MRKTLQQLEDFAITRRDDRASDFATQKYWAAYLDGIKAAKNSSDVLGSENAEGQGVSEEIEVRLVPVEVFGAGCEDRDHESQWGYGLSDAVSAWSDCNRAYGHIFRFDDDFQVPFRLAGETLKVRVDRDEYEAFAAKRWADGFSVPRRVTTPNAADWGHIDSGGEIITIEWPEGHPRYTGEPVMYRLAEVFLSKDAMKGKSDETRNDLRTSETTAGSAND